MTEQISQEESARRALVREEFRERVCEDRNISHLLKANPFSTIRNVDYGGRLEPWLFRELFYVEEGLEGCRKQVSDLLADAQRNMVLISGYQGCGKTVFVHYLVEDLVAERNGLRRISPSFIDFEREGGESRKHPHDSDIKDDKFSGALVRHLKRRLLALDDDGEWIGDEEFSSHRDAFVALAEAIEPRIEANYTGYAFQKFIVRYAKMEAKIGYDEREQLVQCIEAMPMGLLFLCVCLHAYATETHGGDAQFRHLMVFDNLDNEIDERKLVSFIEEFVEFNAKSSAIFNKLRQTAIAGFGLDGCDFYENFTFLFCLRDTNKAKFTMHVRDRDVYLACDISESVDKRKIITKRIEYLDKCELRAGEALEQQAEVYRTLIEDTYFFDRVYPLFNNNQRKVSDVIQVTFMDPMRASSGSGDSPLASEYHNIMRSLEGSSSRDDFVQGAHGILFRLLVDCFRREGYLRLIGGIDRRMSIPRMVLTKLFNLSPVHNREDGVPDEAKMTAQEMWKAFERLDGIDANSLAKDVVEMYKLFKKRRWAHLLEIETELEIDAKSLADEMTGASDPPVKTYLYITCAGRMFVNVMSSHFEYFASRYLPKSKPLYSADNLEVGDAGLVLKDLLDREIGCVERCARRVLQNDKRVAKAYFKKDMEQCLESSYQRAIVAERASRHQTHTERVVASHIGYIDSYRMFLLGVESGVVDAKSLDRRSVELFRARRNEIIRVLLDSVVRLVILLQEQIRSDHATTSGKLLYCDFRRQLDRVASDKAGRLHSEVPVGDLASVRDGRPRLTEDQIAAMVDSWLARPLNRNAWWEFHQR